MRLDGKRAVVTGAAYGNGRGIARRFAQEGARVALADLDERRNAETLALIEAAGGEAFTVRCDVSQRAAVQALIDQTIARFGGVDILVANAGISSAASLLEMTDEQWDRVLAVNLTGVFLCGQIAARAMVAAGRPGKIINIASVYSEICGPNSTNYCAAKGGVRMLTKAMAVDLAPYKINVNCIGPGIINTGMSEKTLATEAGMQRYLEIVPWGRVGQPEDIAATATFLASEDSDYITGTQIFVDGGWLLR